MNANIIVILFSKKTSTNGLYLISLIVDNKHLSFEGETALTNLLNYFLNFQTTFPKRRELIIYSPNAAFCFLFFISQNKVLENLFIFESFLNAGSVYSFSLITKCKKLTIKFKCLSKFTLLSEELYSIKIEPKYFEKNKEIASSKCKDLQKILTILGEKISPLYINWNKYSYSISSVALFIFIKNFNIFNIKFKTKEEEDNLFRPAYFGGRCEIFGNSDNNYEKIFHFDFTSMYGQIMCENFPINAYELKETSLCINNPGFYFAKINSIGMNIPVLPHLVEQDENDENFVKGIVYTNGEFSGLYWHEELILFKDMGGQIINLDYGYVFTNKLKPCFKDFALHCINSRTFSANNNKFWKSILVSFYGRLGMGIKKTETKIFNKWNYKSNLKNKNIINEVWFGDYGVIEYEVKLVKGHIINSNVIYAAIITSKARIKLYKSFISVQNNGGRLLYCDTDSIFAAYKKDVTGETHGEINWNPNNKDLLVEKAVFASTRCYSILTKTGFTTKIAGTKRNSITYEDFFKTFYGKSGNFFFIESNFLKAFSSLDWKNSKILSLETYNKRIFNKSKNKTTPFFKFKKEYIQDPTTDFK